MNPHQARRIETPRGVFLLRPAQAEDDAFLFGLFAANNIEVLRLAGFPEPMVESLIAFQYRSRTATYRSLFPDACHSIVEWGGVSIGELIEHDETQLVYFVDYVLLPQRQAQGLGTALLRVVMDQWAARGRGTRVKVLINNEPSLKLCRKLGMVQTAADEMGYVELRRIPPVPDKP